MKLSILCVTNNEYAGTEAFIRDMMTAADMLRAEFVLGLDREKAQTAAFRQCADVVIDLTANTLQEDVLDQAIKACSGDWVLRLDDDETISMALFQWLQSDGYIQAGSQLYAFPRVYFYPDVHHFLVNDGVYPDLQTRLGKRDLMTGYNYIHAGNPHGTGTVAPYAIEHHKLLVRTREEREAIAARYESIRPGAGSRPEYARYNLPELFYPELKAKEYTSGGNFSAA